MKIIQTVFVCSFLINFLTLSPPNTMAMWVKLSDLELVERSDIIIIGEIVQQKQVVIETSQITVGVVRIDAVLKGSKNQTEVLLKFQGAGAVTKSDDIHYRKGQKGLWFLRKQCVGGLDIYLADHPQRFVPQKDIKATMERLQNILDSTR